MKAMAFWMKGTNFWTVSGCQGSRNPMASINGEYLGVHYLQHVTKEKSRGGGWVICVINFIKVKCFEFHSHKKQKHTSKWWLFFLIAISWYLSKTSIDFRWFHSWFFLQIYVPWLRCSGNHILGFLNYYILSQQFEYCGHYAS